MECLAVARGSATQQLIEAPGPDLVQVIRKGNRRPIFEPIASPSRHQNPSLHPITHQLHCKEGVPSGALGNLTGDLALEP